VCGRVYKTLEAEGLLENTTSIFLSDNSPVLKDGIMTMLKKK
jgi:arylsulfatase A-like enzyme